MSPRRWQLRGTPHAILMKSEPSNSSLRWMDKIPRDLARFVMRRFVGFLAERGVTRERPVLSPKEAARLELRSAYEDYLRRQRGLSERTIIDSWRRSPSRSRDPADFSQQDNVTGHPL